MNNIFFRCIFKVHFYVYNSEFLDTIGFRMFLCQAVLEQFLLSHSNNDQEGITGDVAKFWAETN